MARTTNKPLKYSAGEKGRNRARVFPDPNDLPPRAVPHPMLVPAPVEGREGRASSGTRATA